MIKWDYKIKPYVYIEEDGELKQKVEKLSLYEKWELAYQLHSVKQRKENGFYLKGIFYRMEL